VEGKGRALDAVGARDAVSASSGTVVSVRSANDYQRHCRGEFCQDSPNPTKFGLISLFIPLTSCL
jgi:hypothetical protein